MGEHQQRAPEEQEEFEDGIVVLGKRPHQQVFHLAKNGHVHGVRLTQGARVHDGNVIDQVHKTAREAAGKRILRSVAPRANAAR